MSANTIGQDENRRRRQTRLVLIGASLAIVATLLVANAHLVYVAFSSQPDCVTHLKGAGENGSYRAAKSAC
jgi:hypothetical protein